MYPPIFPWTRQMPNVPLLSWKPRTPHGDLEVFGMPINRARRHYRNDKQDVPSSVLFRPMLSCKIS